jgi:hypothetical protein
MPVVSKEFTNTAARTKINGQLFYEPNSQGLWSGVLVNKNNIVSHYVIPKNKATLEKHGASYFRTLSAYAQDVDGENIILLPAKRAQSLDSFLVKWLSSPSHVERPPLLKQLADGYDTALEEDLRTKEGIANQVAAHTRFGENSDSKAYRTGLQAMLESGKDIHERAAQHAMVADALSSDAEMFQNLPPDLLPALAKFHKSLPPPTAGAIR